MNKTREITINNVTYQIIGTFVTNTFTRPGKGSDSHDRHTRTPRDVNNEGKRKTENCWLKTNEINQSFPKLKLVKLFENKKKNITFVYLKN